MILAAGRGERLRPLTDTLPKALVPAAGKPLIAWHLERLAASGCREAVINVSHLAAQIVERLGDGRDFGLSIAYSREPEPLETAGGIVQALPLLGERFVVVNGDVFTDFDFRQLRDLPANDDLAHLVLVRNPEHHPAGDFGVERNRVLETAAERHTFSGIGVYRHELFADLDAGARKLAPLLREAMRLDRVSGQLHAGNWSDVGTAKRLSALNGT